MTTNRRFGLTLKVWSANNLWFGGEVTRDASCWRDLAVPAEEAVALVKAGDRIFVGSACATPRKLLAALQANALNTLGAQLVHFLTDGAVVGDRSAYRHRVFYVGNDVRKLVEPDRVDYVPLSLAEIPQLMRSGRLPLDVALVQVSPPDDDGMCSLGVSVDVSMQAVLEATTVIAEINPRMPRAHGNTSSVPYDRFAAVVEVDEPVIEYVHPEIGPAAEQIARYIARIVDDGSTLQIGLGRVPNEMLRYLSNRRDLAIHSDVITEPLVDLLESGVVTGAARTDRSQAVVASLAMGTRRLYDLLEDERVVMEPIDSVCHPAVLARQERLVSVTQAFAVDLTGQVVADSSAGRPYGGVSAQSEFHRAASLSPGGRAVVCLTSTTSDGESAIRPTLLGSEAVAIPRHEVRWVVTEYGLAYLFGKSLRERAVALIEIAHPDHRETLLADAQALGLVAKDQKMRSRSAYPAQEERSVALRNGEPVLLRPTKTADAALLQALFFRLRPDDIYTRFFRKLSSLTLSMAEHLCSVGYEQEMALVAVVGEAENERVVGTGSYYLDASTGLADVAYMVDPAWHGVGLGTALQDRMVEYAKRHGVQGFTADVLTENAAMVAVLRKADADVTVRLVDGEYEVVQLFSAGN